MHPDNQLPADDPADEWYNGVHGLDWAADLETELLCQEEGEACRLGGVRADEWLDEFIQSETAHNLIVAALRDRPAEHLSELAELLRAEAGSAANEEADLHFRAAFAQWEKNNAEI
ncbi:hypothetical protein C1141_20950 [Vibrio agarivorans]|nr:hypothetical protein C1141_20950 [Vibrio agarivorans]